MPDVVLTIESRRAVRIALKLREIEYVLQLVAEGKLPEEERERMGRRQEQLLAVAGMLESAVKDQSPEPKPHERPKQANSKQVWCSRQGCTRALTREQAKVSSACLVCRLEDEKKLAAAK